MALVNCLSIVARTSVFALVLLPLAAAADNAQLLAEFRKTKPDVSQVHVISEQPLLVATTVPATGAKGWQKGELLGVFAHRGDQIVPISVSPNDDFPTEISIDRQTADSITFGLADPQDGARSDGLKIFFDPKTAFPKRIVRFSPVHVRRISLVAGMPTLIGSDGKIDFTAREQKGVWHVTTAPGAALAPIPPLASVAQIEPMPVSTFGEFEKARPDEANKRKDAVIEERIGPYQKVGTKIWVGKAFYDFGGSVGVGDLGYFDQTKNDWLFLHLTEMADWSSSALLVETDAVWVGLVRNEDGTEIPGGLLRYDLTSRKVTKIAVADVIDKIVAVGKRIYCGTSGGFAVIEQGQAKQFEFEPQFDGSYVVTPVT